MTWIDWFPLVLLVAYGVGGFFSGLIRRFIGLVALFVALWAATAMGLQAGAILQQTSSFEVADGRIYGFFGILVFVLVIVEAATQLAHSQIQIQAVILNRTLGVVLGVITAILLSVVVVHELNAAAYPSGGAQLDALEIHIRDAIRNSLFMARLVEAIDRPILALFSPLLPYDPNTYFGPAPVS